MTSVKVTRTTNHYRRSVNGAWLGNGSTDNTFEIDESRLDKRFSLGSGIKVEFEDGLVEHAYELVPGCPGYPPHCIPVDGRLAVLLNREPLKD